MSDEYVADNSGEVVLCGASAYTQKFYLNESFKDLPLAIQDELKIMCVLHTADVGGIVKLVYGEEGTINMISECDEEDILYDEIGAALKVKQARMDRSELFESLELYYRVVFLGEQIDFE